jgi:UDP-arabinose 4-epimerase
MMNDNTILVTGGAGYIGAHVCKKLAIEGFLPVTYDNLSTGHAYAVKWGPFIQASLSDRTQLQNALLTYRPKAVMHFAASAIVTESMQDPGKYYRNNLLSTLSLLEAMRECEVKHLVFSSTCATYGNPLFNPMSEKHPQLPINPYGRSKLMLEQIMADFDQIHNFKTVCLRYFNAAGADLQTEIGENHTPETHLIPTVIQAALGMKPEVVVYGTDFPTRDGSAIRDYIHVQDLADAHVAALKWVLSNRQSTSINLGTGIGHSVFEIIEAVQKYCSHAIPVRLEQKRTGEPAILVAENDLAAKLLDWKPKYSDLPTLIESAWKWHQLLVENAVLLRKTIQKIGAVETSSIHGH